MSVRRLNPFEGVQGWCHNCETWQHGKDARWLYMRWGGFSAWACIRCDDEPWGLGVWPVVGCPEHVELFRTRADGLEVAYPDGVCDECDAATEARKLTLSDVMM